MTIVELEKAWNAEQRENAWNDLGLDEIVAFAQEVERARIVKTCEELSQKAYNRWENTFEPLDYGRAVGIDEVIGTLGEE